MAYFDHRRDSCSRCGSTGACVYTDARVSSGVAWSKEDVRNLCFSCYLDVVDGNHGVGVLDVGDGAVVVSADSVEATEDVAEAVADEALSTVVHDVEVQPADGVFQEAFEGDGPLSDYYVREVVRGVDSEVRAIYGGTSGEGSVVDVESHLSRGGQRKVDDTCFTALRRHSEDVDTKSDLRQLTRTDESPYPALARHGVLRRVEGRIWSYVKEAGFVSDSSLTSSENQERGREFERYFEELCRERGLTPHRPSSEALRSLYPDVHSTLQRKFTASLSGIPDYFVEADGHSGWGDRWRPTEDCFVEVKRGGSHMSRRQSKMTAHLKSHGFPVYVLRGEPGDHRFEER